jgi:hypothetical protein
MSLTLLNAKGNQIEKVELNVQRVTDLTRRCDAEYMTATTIHDEKVAV